MPVQIWLCPDLALSRACPGCGTQQSYRAAPGLAWPGLAWLKDELKSAGKNYQIAADGMRFDRDETGEVTGITGLYWDGRTDETLRSE